MMKGVEVLNVIKNGGWSIPMLIFSLVFVMFAIWFIVLSVKFIRERMCWILISSMILCCMCSIFTIICSYTKPYNTYQVTISDEVKMIEFNEKYDIIDVNGKIYTIREKE